MLPDAEVNRPLDDLLATSDLPELLAPLRQRLPRPFRPRFSPDADKSIREQLTESLLTPVKVEAQGVAYHLLVDRNDTGLLLFEPECAEARDRTPAALLETLRPSVEAVETAGDLHSLLERLVTTVRRLTGFERVMAYRFGRDGHGEVIAEDASPEVPSFLGLHDPGSDIPRPVRELFLRNPMRLIVDRDAELVPLQPSAMASGLDLGRY